MEMRLNINLEPLCCWEFLGLPSIGVLIFFSVIDDFFGKSLFYNRVEILHGKLIAKFLTYATLAGIPIYVVLEVKKAGGVLMAISPEHEQEEIRRTGKSVRNSCKQCSCISAFHSKRLTEQFRKTYEEASTEMRLKSEEFR